MAILTLDDALAGMQSMRPFMSAVSATPVAGRPISLWDRNGIPGPGLFDTTLAGVALSSSGGLVQGQIPHYDPVSGDAHLARLVAQASTLGTLLLCDRLWHNGGMSITSTSAQTINSATFPARDNAGTTDGDGVLLGVEVSAATGAGTPTLTLGYTNSAGASGRSATNLDATVASTAAGAFYRLGVQGGDTGVRSVQTFQQSATWTSGTINLVAYRVLAVLEIPAAYGTGSIDVLTGGLPRIFDGAVPFVIFIPGNTTAFRVTGGYTETQG